MSDMHLEPTIKFIGSDIKEAVFDIVSAFGSKAYASTRCITDQRYICSYYVHPSFQDTLQLYPFDFPFDLPYQESLTKSPCYFIKYCILLHKLLERCLSSLLFY